MKERITLLTAIAAIVLVAFARCERACDLLGPSGLDRSGPGPSELGEEHEQHDLPAVDPDQFTVGPVVPRSPVAVPQPDRTGPTVTAPHEQLLVPVRPDRSTVYHHIIFGDIDNPHADQDMTFKPPGNRTWPMPVLPRAK